MIQPTVNCPFKHGMADLPFRVRNWLICFPDLLDRGWADRSSLTKNMPDAISSNANLGPPSTEYTAPPTAPLVQFIIALLKGSIEIAETIWQKASGTCTGQRVSNLNFKLSWYLFIWVWEKQKSFITGRRLGWLVIGLSTCFLACFKLRALNSDTVIFFLRSVARILQRAKSIRNNRQEQLTLKSGVKPSIHHLPSLKFIK